MSSSCALLLPVASPSRAFPPGRRRTVNMVTKVNRVHSVHPVHSAPSTNPPTNKPTATFPSPAGLLPIRLRTSTRKRERVRVRVQC